MTPSSVTAWVSFVGELGFGAAPACMAVDATRVVASAAVAARAVTDRDFTVRLPSRLRHPDLAGSSHPSRGVRLLGRGAPSLVGRRRPAHRPLHRQARLVARQALGLIPNCWWNHREKALGAVNPSSWETSVIVYRSFAR